MFLWWARISVIWVFKRAECISCIYLHYYCHNSHLAWHHNSCLSIRNASPIKQQNTKVEILRGVKVFSGSSDFLILLSEFWDKRPRTTGSENSRDLGFLTLKAWFSICHNYIFLLNLIRGLKSVHFKVRIPSSRPIQVQFLGINIVD